MDQPVVENATAVYSSTVSNSRAIIVTGMVMAILGLVLIGILWGLAYTGNVKYNSQIGPAGPAGPQGQPGADGAPGQTGPTGLPGKSAPPAPMNQLQNGTLVFPLDQNRKPFTFTFPVPYKYINGIPQCFVQCLGYAIPNPGTSDINVPAFTTTISFIVDTTNSIVTGVNGILGTNYGGAWPGGQAGVSWWASVIE